MDGLYYLTYIIAIYVVIQWYAANEAAKTGTGDVGLLAMKRPEAVKPSKAARRAGRKPPRYTAYGED